MIGIDQQGMEVQPVAVLPFAVGLIALVAKPRTYQQSIPRQQLTQLSIVGTRWHQQQADDLATLFLRLAGGKSGTVGSYGYAQGGPQNSTHLLCERGALRMDVLTLEVGRDDRWESVPLALPENVVTSALAEEWCDFRRWVEQGSAPQVTPEFAGQVMQVVFAAEQSSAEGREIRLA